MASTGGDAQARKAAIAHVLVQLEDATLSDKAKLVVPTGFEHATKRMHGFAPETIKLRAKLLKGLIHPDKNMLPEEHRVRCEEATKLLGEVVDRLLHQEGRKSASPVGPQSPPQEKTPPDVRKARILALKMRDLVLNESLTDRERIKPVRGSVPTGLKWSDEDLRIKAAAIKTTITAGMPVDADRDTEWQRSLDMLETIVDRMINPAVLDPVEVPPSCSI